MSWRKDFAHDGETRRVTLRHVSGSRYSVQVGDASHDVDATLLPDGRVRYSLDGTVFEDAEMAAKGVGVAPSEAFAVSRMTAPPGVRISLSAAPDRVLLRSALTTIAETLADDPMGETAIF